MLLVTDLGFLNEYGHVWHVLRDIDDSGEFLDAGFQPSGIHAVLSEETCGSSTVDTAGVTDDGAHTLTSDGQNRIE